jgi:5'-deoxynucleotidase YfbR-like HD superfamily hydrolase/competence protein ComGF
MKPELILKLFDAFTIQRWNDQVRPADFVEIDKHGHKMAIVYCLARCENEVKGTQINWGDLIKGGVYELLRRSALSDIKSPVYRLIKNEFPDAHTEMNEWAWNELKPCLEDGEMKDEIHSYLVNGSILDETACRILDAGHVFASYWEWQIIRNLNPASPYIVGLNERVNNDLEEHMDLVGIKRLVSRQKLLRFIDLLGRLRFQVRWGQALRLPKTSVLGHSMFVACLTYFFTKQFDACEERIKNNFFGGLFHDLPESVTRDIISPLKRGVRGLEGVITDIEKKLMEKDVYPHLEPACREEISYYTTDEFDCKIKINSAVSKTSFDEINRKFNQDKFHPIDGELIKVADHLSAYVEARLALQNGFQSVQLKKGEESISRDYKEFQIAGIDVGALYKKVRDMTS